MPPIQETPTRVPFRQIGRLTLDNVAHDLMTRNDVLEPRSKFAFNDVQDRCGKRRKRALSTERDRTEGAARQSMQFPGAAPQWAGRG
jgi:hypothetical protein